MRAFIAARSSRPAGLRGATQESAEFLAALVAATLGATWGLAEAERPVRRTPTGPRQPQLGGGRGRVAASVDVLTGDDDRDGNMVAFATSALELLAAQLV